ncbi:MAG: 16S rRNA (uracil(1498)-N(3))-methyltransferase [Hyphomonadaceae bacterium]
MKNVPRLYIDAPLTEGNSITLPEGQAHYLARVMRLGGGDIARIFNGKDGEWEAELSLHGRKVDAELKNLLRAQPDQTQTGPKLLFAPLKKTRTDFAVEKATELGVSQIMPVATERTQTRRVKTDRLRALAIEAAEQTERMDVPDILDMANLDHALAQWDNAAPLVFCDEAGDDENAIWGGEEGRAKTIAKALEGHKPEGGGLLIGPEGGFSLEERSHLRTLDFVIPVTLGPRILRAETAIVAGLTIWQAVLGDWQ